MSESLMGIRNRPRFRSHVLILSALLIVAAASMLNALGGRDSISTMETVTIATAQETWLRYHAGDDISLIIPTNSGIRRIRKPPLVVWTDMATWLGLGPQEAHPDALILRARAASVGVALIMLAALYWMAHRLRGVRFAILATVVASSMLLLQRQGRTASYDIHFAAWVTLGVAGVIHALSATTSRQRWIGWASASVGMLLACYAKNPLGLALVAIPGAVAIALDGRTRVRSAVNLLLATAAAGAGVGVWYAIVWLKFPETVQALSHEFTQPRGSDAQVFFYYLGLFGLVAPWTIWLFSGLIHPFNREYARLDGDDEPARTRLRRLFPIAWFILIFVLFSIPEAKQQRYILPIIPAAAMLVAGVWFDHERRAVRGEVDRSIRPFIWIHWLLLAAGSIALGTLLFRPDLSGAVQSHLPDDDRGAFFGPTSPLIGIGGGLALLALAAWGLVTHLRWRPFRAGVIGGAWGLLAFGLIWQGYGSAPSGVHPLKAPTRALAASLDDARIFEFRTDDLAERRGLLNEEFRIYLGRLIERANDETLRAALDSDEPFYLLVRPRLDEALTPWKPRLIYAGEVRTDKPRDNVPREKDPGLMDLWEFPGLPKAAVTPADTR